MDVVPEVLLPCDVGPVPSNMLYRQLFLILRFLLVFKIVHRLQCPEQLTDYLQLRSSLHSRSLRDNTLLHLLKVKTSIGQSTFQYSAAADWNSLPRSIREITSLASGFKSKLYNYLRDLDRAAHRCSCN